MYCYTHTETHSYILIHTVTYRNTQLYTVTHSYLPIHTVTYRYTQLHTCTVTHSYILLNTVTYRYTQLHSCTVTHSYIPLHTVTYRYTQLHTCTVTHSYILLNTVTYRYTQLHSCTVTHSYIPLHTVTYRYTQLPTEYTPLHSVTHSYIPIHTVTFCDKPVRVVTFMVAYIICIPNLECKNYSYVHYQECRENMGFNLFTCLPDIKPHPIHVPPEAMGGSAWISDFLPAVSASTMGCRVGALLLNSTMPI